MIFPAPHSLNSPGEKELIHELIVCPWCEREIAITGTRDRAQSKSMIPCNDKCKHE